MHEHIGGHDAMRFWSKVDIRGTSDCWPWIGALNSSGYGSFHPGGLPVRNTRSNVGAHRAAFFLTHGRWPTDVARHTCDNRCCCNPAHIVEGSQKDNVADMIARGRRTCVSPRGESHGAARLTVANVVAIRILCAQGIPQAEVGLRFGVRQQTVSDIVLGKKWKHVSRDLLAVTP